MNTHMNNIYVHSMEYHSSIVTVSKGRCIPCWLLRCCPLKYSKCCVCIHCIYIYIHIHILILSLLNLLWRSGVSRSHRCDCAGGGVTRVQIMRAMTRHRNSLRPATCIIFCPVAAVYLTFIYIYI